MEALGASVTIACPAFPANKRTVYRGHLFVGDLLLSDSPMKDHPLTPMRDASLVRVLQAQTRLPVGLVAREVVAEGPAAIRAAFSVGRAIASSIEGRRPGRITGAYCTPATTGTPRSTVGEVSRLEVGM